MTATVVSLNRRRHLSSADVARIDARIARHTKAKDVLSELVSRYARQIRRLEKYRNRRWRPQNIGKPVITIADGDDTKEGA